MSHFKPNQDVPEQVSITSPSKPRGEDVRLARFKKVLTILMFIGFVVIVFKYLQPEILYLLEMIQDQGVLGVFFYMIIFIIWSICMMPQTPMELAAAVIWSFPVAVLVGWTSKQLGSYACFWIGRKAGKQTVESKLRGDQSLYLKSIDTALHEKPHKINFLASSAYIPAGIKNYGMGTLPVCLFLIISLSLPLSLFLINISP